MRRRASGGRAALRPPGERSGGTGPAAGRRPVRRRASGEQVHCARPETVGGSGPATGRRPARRREPGDRAHSARPANGRVSRAGLGPTAGGGDEQSAIRHTVPARRAVRCGETGSRRSGTQCPPGERSTGPGRQRAGGWRGEQSRRSCAPRRVRRRVRPAGGSESSAGVGRRPDCAGPGRSGGPGPDGGRQCSWRRRGARSARMRASGGRARCARPESGRRAQAGSVPTAGVGERFRWSFAPRPPGGCGGESGPPAAASRRPARGSVLAAPARPLRRPGPGGGGGARGRRRGRGARTAAPRGGVSCPLPMPTSSSPKDTRLSEQTRASNQTRAGGELPRSMTQRVLRITSLSCGPLGRLRCTVAVPREERARAVVETGPRGRHGATQEPHSAPAQDA